MVSTLVQDKLDGRVDVHLPVAVDVRSVAVAEVSLHAVVRSWVVKIVVLESFVRSVVERMSRLNLQDDKVIVSRRADE